MSKSTGGLEIEQRSTLVALEEIRAELSQLSEHQLLHQNVVPLTALVTVRGVYRELKGLRAEMMRLPDFEINNLNRLELYAMAFVGAQARYDALRQSNREPEALKAEAEALRAQLCSDAKALVRRKIVAPQRIEKLSHLVTHGAIFGMTGSGKTGLLTVMVEEALAAGVPTLMIDIKGDLPNLLLNFPRFDPSDLAPWVESVALSEEKTTEQVALEQNELRRNSLAAWNIGEPELRTYHEKTDFRVITPGSSSGELLHVLSSLERRSDRWDVDPESARDALSAAVSLVLRLLGRDPDPAKSREHVLLSVLAEERLRRGEPASLARLLEDLAKPPIEKVGALGIDAFLPKSERKALAAALNTLLASPTFAS